MAAALWHASIQSGCIPELVSGNDHENHVLFNGLSPDGRLIAIGWDRRTGEAVARGTFLLDLRNGTRINVRGLNNAASFSRSGRYLVSANYAADRALKTEIVEFDLRTGKTRNVASGNSAEWLATYSPDDKWIVFNSTRSGTSDVYRFRRSDGKIEQLTSDPRYEAHASLFDGGRKLVFHRQTSGNDYDIVVRDLRSGTEQTIGATPSEEAYPAPSPDGHWVAFSSATGRESQPNLFVMRANGGERRRLTTAPEKDAYAAWSPDGRWIYFVRFHEPGSKIYRLRWRTCSE